MSEDFKLVKPNSKRSNVLVCFTGNPFDPADLVNMFELGVFKTNTTGTFLVTHWSGRDASKALLEDFDQLDEADNIGVTVFHEDVSPERICQSCGKQIGKR